MKLYSLVPNGKTRKSIAPLKDCIMSGLNAPVPFAKAIRIVGYIIMGSTKNDGLHTDMAVRWHRDRVNIIERYWGDGKRWVILFCCVILWVFIRVFHPYTYLDFTVDHVP